MYLSGMQEFGKEPDMSVLFDYKETDTTSYQQNDANIQGLGIISEQGLGSFWESTGENESPLNMDVCVCVDSPEPERFHASAVTKGNHIFLSTGAENLLRHEMGHVIQQRNGVVPATGSVEGQKINDNVALEKEADQLGSMIPQQVVLNALSHSNRGLSLQNTQGVIQCSGKGNSTYESQTTSSQVDKIMKKIHACIQEWQNCICELDSLRKERSSKKKQTEIEAQKKLCEQYEKNLQDLLEKIYPGHTDFVTDLVQQIKLGNYTDLSLTLFNHLYNGYPISSPHIVKSKPTGLHAYSDQSMEPATSTTKPSEGVLPKRIRALGYIGDRDQVHILHWSLMRKKKSSKTKFSTMLPITMPEAISRLMFTVASKSSGSRRFGNITIVKKGNTLYPIGDNVQVLDEKGNEAGTLSEIYDKYNPATHKDKPVDLTKLEFYHSL